MKKIISALFVAVCCLAMAMPAQAQVKFGLKGGLNFSKIDISGTLEGNFKENSTGFFIGPMVEATVPIIGIGVDGAIMYSQRGKSDTKQQGIEIPINLKYTIGLGDFAGIFLAAGPDLFFNMKDVNFSDGINAVKDKKAIVGLNLGAGLKLVNHLQLGVTYQIGLGDTFSIKEAGKKISNKTNTWQISLAYMF
ncbi:MAG: porin family protein [Bacteroidaceae bacterium]|nr:porin family protein [Bacteroidaceae bacterium]